MRVRCFASLIVLGLSIIPTPVAARSLFIGNTGVFDGAVTGPLATLGYFDSFTSFDVRTGTPTLSQLQDHDAVLIYSDYPVPNATGLGNVLADFVDSGGRLLVATYALSSPWAPTGRITTPGYLPFVDQSVIGGVSGQFVALTADDSVFRFPNTITPSAVTHFHNLNFAHPSVDAGALLLADDGAGVPLLAVNAAGTVAALNMFPETIKGNSAEFFRLLENVLARVATRVCGNGIIDAGEQCDDGNILSGDGCSTACKVEPCFGCTGTPSACTAVGAGVDCGHGEVCIHAACDGAGTCVHDDPRPSECPKGYAVLGCSNASHVQTDIFLGSGTAVAGDVCANTIKALGGGTVSGNVVAEQSTGGAVRFVHAYESIDGNLATGGGTIAGLAKAHISGRADVSGTSMEVADCASACTTANERRVALTSLAATITFADPIVSPVRYLYETTVTVGPGRQVVDTPAILVKPRSTLRFVGGFFTEQVIVRVHGPMRFGYRSRFELQGLRPEQVLFLVDGDIVTRAYIHLMGTFVSAGAVRLGRMTRIDGQVIGPIDKLGSLASVTLHAFEAW